MTKGEFLKLIEGVPDDAWIIIEKEVGFTSFNSFVLGSVSKSIDGSYFLHEYIHQNAPERANAIIF
jgi:hypothetical protein